MATPITTALDILEDAILVALRGVSPAGQGWQAWDAGVAAAWGVAPADTVRRLGLSETDDDYLPYALVAQHQDGGGRPDSRIHEAGWAGLIVIRSLSRDDARARAGLARAVTQAAALTSPTGYALSLVWDRPIAIPLADKVYARAGQWRARVRRTT